MNDSYGQFLICERKVILADMREKMSAAVGDKWRLGEIFAPRTVSRVGVNARPMWPKWPKWSGFSEKGQNGDQKQFGHHRRQTLSGLPDSKSKKKRKLFLAFGWRKCN